MKSDKICVTGDILSFSLKLLMPGGCARIESKKQKFRKSLYFLYFYFFLYFCILISRDKQPRVDVYTADGNRLSAGEDTPGGAAPAVIQSRFLGVRGRSGALNKGASQLISSFFFASS